MKISTNSFNDVGLRKLQYVKNYNMLQNFISPVTDN